MSACAVADESTTEGQVLSEESSGQLVSLRPGEMLNIRLKTVLGTGYDWRVASLNSKHMELVSSRIETGSQEGMPGMSEVHLFRLRALETGKTTLRLVYTRSWELDKQPEKEFQVTVEIK